MNKTINKKEGVLAKGTHIISVCKIETESAFNLQKRLEWLRVARQTLIASGLSTTESLRSMWYEYTFTLELLHKKFLQRQYYVENIVTTEGRVPFAQRLGGDTTYTGIVNYGALGDDNSAPAVGDTALGNEVYRKALSSGTNLSTTTYLENFYTAAEVSGTFEEYGFFIDGGAGADSGQIFNRFTQTVAKAVTESLNVQSQVAWNNG